LLPKEPRDTTLDFETMNFYPVILHSKELQHF